MSLRTGRLQQTLNLFRRQKVNLLIFRSLKVSIFSAGLIEISCACLARVKI